MTWASAACSPAPARLDPVGVRARSCHKRITSSAGPSGASRPDPSRTCPARWRHDEGHRRAGAVQVPRGRGRRHRLRHPRRARSCPPTTRCSTRASATSCAATSRAPGTPRRATRKRAASPACVSRRPGRARRTWSPRSPTRRWTRSPWSRSPGRSRRRGRQRRVPGGRHHRHHDAGHEAQLARHGPARHRRGDPRGVPHRDDRPARPRPRRHPEGRPRERDRMVVAGVGRPARLQADHQGQPASGLRSREDDPRRAPPGALRGRRASSTAERPRSCASSGETGTCRS